MGKKPRSFSIDEDIDTRLTDRDDLNASAAVNTFLRHYLASGRGEEAALAVRLEQLDAEIADTKKELEQLERERERIQAALDERQSDLARMLAVAEEKINEGQFPTENIEPSNAAVQNWANKAGVSPQRFTDELLSRLG